MDLALHLRRQSGVVSRAQARALGMSEEAIRWRVTSGAWTPLNPAVFAVGDPSPAGRVHAVALWAGPEATIAGAAAAWWWGLIEDAPDVVDVRTRRHLESRDAIRVSHRDVPGADRAHRLGVAVTSLPLTVLDLAVALGDEQGQAALDRALRRRITLAQVRAAHFRGIGRAGSPAAARLLRAAGDRAASDAERRTIRALRDAGITGWEVNARLGLPDRTLEIDLLFREARLVIEVDGWAWHIDHERFHADRERQNALVLAGWRVLRLTWRDLQDPARVVALVRRALAQAA